MENPRLSIVAPIYNEVESIDEFVHEIKTVLDTLNTPYEIILVNDGSDDGSEEKINAAARRNPAIIALHFTRNFGQTAAMGAGIDHARGDIIITIDADLQNDPSAIPHLLAKLDEGYDIVSGWRHNRQDGALSRKLPSLIANRLIGTITGIEIHDYGCTLKAYRAHVIKRVKFYGDMHRFLPAYASRFGARVTEIQVPHRARKFGRTKYGLFSRLIRVFVDMFLIRFYLTYFDRPLHLFGRWGIICITLGGLSGIFALYLKLIKHVSFIETPLPLLTVFLILIGFICIMLGIMAEILTRIYFESTHNKPYVIKEMTT